MRHLFKKWYLVFTLLIITALVVPALGCNTTPASTTTTASTSAAGPALTVVNGSQTKTFTMAELKAMTTLSGWAGQMSSTGNITGPNQYKGVSMMDILKTVGGVTEKNAVRVTAKDGYAMTVSYRQLMEGNFTVIDSTNGKEMKPAKLPVVFLAYEMDGAPIGDSLGPVRLGIMTGEKQVTEGHWWVKWTQKIEVVAIEQPWTLHLEGAMKEDIDPASFESCSAIGCHGQKWTDDQGRSWEGVPLYYFVGKVDDNQASHEKDGFNLALADKGYEVHIVASDGYVQKFTSAEVKKNTNVILAFRRDGAPLPENQWPLRVVGGAVEKSRQVGKVAFIKVQVAGAAATTTATAKTTTAAAPDTGETVLTVVNGTTTKTYTLTAFKVLTVTSGTGATKNKAGTVSSPVTYTGVALTEIIKAAGGMKDTQSVKITAKDGFVKTLTYKQVYSGDLVVMDSAGNPAAASQPPVVAVVYAAGGNALDASSGPLQLAILTASNQVSEASMWVKQTVKVEIVNP